MAHSALMHSLTTNEKIEFLVPFATNPVIIRTVLQTLVPRHLAEIAHESSKQLDSAHKIITEFTFEELAKKHALYCDHEKEILDCLSEIGQRYLIKQILQHNNFYIKPCTILFDNFNMYQALQLLAIHNQMRAGKYVNGSITDFGESNILISQSINSYNRNKFCCILL